MTPINLLFDDQFSSTPRRILKMKYGRPEQDCSAGLKISGELEVSS